MITSAVNNFSTAEAQRGGIAKSRTGDGEPVHTGEGSLKSLKIIGRLALLSHTSPFLHHDGVFCKRLTFFNLLVSRNWRLSSKLSIVSTTKRNEVRMPIAAFPARCQYDHAKADIAIAVNSRMIRSFFSVHPSCLSTASERLCHRYKQYPEMSHFFPILRKVNFVFHVSGVTTSATAMSTPIWEIPNRAPVA